MARARLRSARTGHDLRPGSVLLFFALLFRPSLHRPLSQDRNTRSKMSERNFFAELKRRNVYKVAVAYAVVAWLTIQVAATIVPALHLPDTITTTVVVIVLLGFPIALVLAWAFELTAGGLKRTEDADALVATNPGVAAQSSRKSYAWIYVIGISAALSVGLFFVGRYSAINPTPRQS